MATLKMNFTQKALDGLSPQPQRYYVHDTKIRGLCLSVFPSGTKTFMLYRKVNDRPVRITLGRFDDLTIEQARKQAEAFNNEIAQGNNPREAINSKRKELTFDDFFQVYLEKHAKVYKKSWRHDADHYRLHINDGLGNKKLSDITRQHIQNLHAHLGQNHGKACANRVIDTLGSVFMKAIEWGYLSGNNPAKIKKFKLQSRDRFLTSEELPRFFQAVQQEENDTLRDYILLSLLTGARKANVLAMRWDQIDLTRGEWRIPETKNGESQRVVLSSEAVQILTAREQHYGQSPWVFPSTGASGHLQDPKKGWQRLLQRAELQDVRIHDLRRTLGSWQAATGANGFVIGKSLGHKSMRATEIYARIDLDPVRHSVQTATRAMFEAGGLG
jgi:integrase